MTTTSTQLEDVWESNIYRHSSIGKITNKLFFHDITQDSEREISTLYYNGKVNCFSTLIAYTDRIVPTNYTERHFTITVHYYREKDADGEAWTAVRDTMETLQGLVDSELGHTWDGYLYFARPQDVPSAIEEIAIQGTAVWHASFSYEAIA